MEKNKENTSRIVCEIEQKALELGVVSKPLNADRRLYLESKIADFNSYVLNRRSRISDKTSKKRDVSREIRLFTEKSYGSARFAQKWGEGVETTPLSNKIKDAVRPPGPLKPRLDLAIKRMEMQIQRLNKAADQFSDRDKSIFAKIVSAYTKHDMARANVFANELAEIRKMEKMIMHSNLALSQIVLRLSTVSELGDVVRALAPAVNVLRSVKAGMSTLFPEAEREIGSIGNLLSGIIMDAGYNSGMNLNFQMAGDDAQKILNEAATVTDQKVKEMFPELPKNIMHKSQKEEGLT